MRRTYFLLPQALYLFYRLNPDQILDEYPACEAACLINTAFFGLRATPIRISFKVRSRIDDDSHIRLLRSALSTLSIPAQSLFSTSIATSGQASMRDNTGAAGFEPATSRLTVERSAIDLHPITNKKAPRCWREAAFKKP